MELIGRPSIMTRTWEALDPRMLADWAEPKEPYPVTSTEEVSLSSSPTFLAEEAAISCDPITTTALGTFFIASGVRVPVTTTSSI